MSAPEGIDRDPSGDPLGLATRHAFDVRLFFGDRNDFGAGPAGAQLFTSIAEGSTVEGPLLSGRVVAGSGGDWPTRRSDGVVVLNAHYVIEADDGTRIYISNHGYVHGALDRTGSALPPYFRCTPYFRAPTGPHDWLNRKVLIGIGQRRPKVTPDDLPDHSLFRYHLVL